MKKVSVEIEIPDGYEFVKFSDVVNPGECMLFEGAAHHACVKWLSGTGPVFIILKRSKKKQIIFTSTGEKKRFPEDGEWYMDDDGRMHVHENNYFRVISEIFTRDEKWV